MVLFYLFIFLYLSSLLSLPFPSLPFLRISYFFFILHSLSSLFFPSLASSPFHFPFQFFLLTYYIFILFLYFFLPSFSLFPVTSYPVSRLPLSSRTPSPLLLLFPLGVPPLQLHHLTSPTSLPPFLLPPSSSSSSSSSLPLFSEICWHFVGI